MDYYLGPHDSPESRREYARLVLELSGAPAASAAGASRAPTIAEVAARWGQHALKKYGPATSGSPEVRQYDNALAVLLELFLALPAADFDSDRLEAVRDRMVAEDGRGWCRTHANRQISRIRTIWRWAEKAKLVPRGSWEHLRSLESLPLLARGVRESPPRRPCTLEEVEKAAGEANPVVRTVLLLCWRTGARPGEFRQLEVGEVDRSGPEWVCRPKRHKNAHRGQPRAVVLSADAQALIAPFLEGKQSEDLVFPAPGKKTAYRCKSLSQAVGKAAAKAGVKLTAYQCRHAAKQRITREMGLDAARAALGQRSILTTDHYASATDEEKAKEVARRCG